MTKWSDSKLKTVQAVWGMLAGTGLFIVAGTFAPHLLEGGVTREEVILAALFLGIGFLAALPGIAFQAIGKGLDIWEKRKNGGS